MTLMKQTRRAHPEIPPAQWMGDDLLFKLVDEPSNALFSEAAKISANLGLARQQAFEARRRAAAQIQHDEAEK